MTQGVPSDGRAMQVLDQFAHHVLIRPLTLYIAPAPREYVPMERRG